MKNPCVRLVSIYSVVIKFPVRLKFVIFKAATSGGMVPERKLFWSSRFVKLAKRPISDGSGPSRTFVPKRMLRKVVTFPIVVGIVEVKKLPSKSSVSTTHWKLEESKQDSVGQSKLTVAASRGEYQMNSITHLMTGNPRFLQV